MRATLLSLFLVSCARVPESELDITNGTKRQPRSSIFSAVLYKGGCTGTFVSATTFITAAHCLPKGFSLKGAKPKSNQTMGEFRGEKWDYANDLRVIVFPKAVSSSWIAISKAKAAKGMNVILAGYGVYDATTAATDENFRIGSNVTEKVDKAGRYISLSGQQAEIEKRKGLDSGTGEGDSGGPLLHDGLLIGVNSSGEDKGKELSANYYIDLSHPDVKAFLDSTVKNLGADINYSDDGSSYQECVDIEAGAEKFSYFFEAPHFQIISEEKVNMTVYRRIGGSPLTETYEKEGVMEGKSFQFKDAAYGVRLEANAAKASAAKLCFL